MCLIVGKEEFKIEIAPKDIVCYKVVEKRKGVLVSPYQGFVYEIGKEYNARIKPPKLSLDSNYCKIKEGFHSFLNEEDARSEKRWLNEFNLRYTNWHLCCCKCIIPKGTNVVYGKYNAKDTIVSEAIKVIEEVL